MTKKDESAEGIDAPFIEKSGAGQESESAPPNLNLNEEFPLSDDDAEVLQKLPFTEIQHPEIETPLVEDEESAAGFFDRVKSRLHEDKTEEPKEKPRKPTKSEEKDFMEAARMFLTPLLILAVTRSLGELCAPTEEEAHAVIEPFARIFARHVPMPEYLSADLIDLLAIGGALVVWATRVSHNFPWEIEKRRAAGREDGREPVYQVEEARTTDNSGNSRFVAREFLYQGGAA